MTSPSVTVAIPVLNEAQGIIKCLEAVTNQAYPGVIEVLVVDGGSTDQTRALAATFPRVRVLDNPRRHQAAGLNVAIAEARGEVLVRVDGHCVIDRDYVANCVAALTTTGAAMAGGGMAPTGGSGYQAVVAAAMRSRLGVGTARVHRPDAPAGWVDTVYLGAFRTDLAREAGGYDERLVTNEDAEFAWRMAQRGGVWFDPAIRSAYYPRSTPGSVARQFFRYGRGRASTVIRHPRSLSARQLAAPALLLGLLTPWRELVVGGYLVVLAAVTATSLRNPVRVAVRVPWAVAIMHVTWGLGFLVGLPKAAGGRLTGRSGA